MDSLSGNRHQRIGEPATGPGCGRDEHLRPLLDDLTGRLRAALGGKLLGLYLWGSYVVGDFDPRLSDLDMVGVLAADVDEREYAALAAAHDGFACDYPEWDGRIEVRYATVATLDHPAEGGEIVSISPGEPLNRRRSDERWQADWYVARERGIALHGPPMSELLAPIPRGKFVACVRALASSWDEWIDDVRGRKGQAYAVLALCRALRSVTHGDQLSKAAAGRWAQAELPAWADLIARAIAWREEPESAPGAPADAATRRFVADVRARVLGARPPADG